MSLVGQKALITGGSRGIGRAVALALAGEGCDVAFTYLHDREAAEQTAAAIRASGRRAWTAQVNLAERPDIDRLFEQVGEGFGRLDIFVSNAVGATLRPVLDLKSRHWDYVMAANLTAFFECSRRSVELMNGNSGVIVAVSSPGSRAYFPGYGALGAAKAGIEALARYLAVELAERNIRVNIVCPGPVDTRAFQAFSSVVPDLHRYKQSLVERTPAKRLGTAEEIARVVVFLCAPQAHWIRGQTIAADGGFSLV